MGFRVAICVVLAGACSTAPAPSGPDASGSGSGSGSGSDVGPIALSTAAPSTEFGNFGKAIAVDGAGYVDVVWMQGGATADAGPFVYAGTASIMFAQSGDGGATWTTSTLANPGVVTSLPRIAASGDDLYATWPQSADNALQVLVAHGVRAGATVTWSAPVAISATPKGASATFPVIAISQTAVHVAWADSRQAGGVTEVFYASSRDRGATWSTPLALSPLDGFNSWTPSLAAAGDDVYLGWTDGRFGAADCTTNDADCHEVVYLRSSADDGASWGDELQLTCDATIYTFAPSLFATSDAIHVAFFQGEPASTGAMQLYYVRGGVGLAGITACEGTAGTLAPIAPAYPAGDTILSSWRPNLAVVDDVVHMVWWGELTTDYAGGQSKIYAATSSDGVAWSAVDSLTPQDAGATYRSFSPNIATDATHAYVIWDDHRDDSVAESPNYQLYFQSRPL